ncbi:MAG TPA: ABC transporter substrate-binding protein [Desulfobulbus sp.]|nr:ABC transporter substrate-binding protein [Desulfobulbus sp.]
MKKKLFIQITLVCFLMALPLVCHSAQGPDPTEQMKPFVQKVMKILKNADFKADPKCIICQRLIDVSRERFDFNEMSKRVLGRTWRKLNKEERADFVDLFTRLLQYAYIGKLEKYTDQKVIFKGERIRGKRAEVQTELNDGQQSVAVSYIMLLEGDQWMIYDVIIEGVSLVRNYMEQFKEILRKEKYNGLVKQIEKKVKQLEEERKQRFSKKNEFSTKKNE